MTDSLFIQSIGTVSAAGNTLERLRKTLLGSVPSAMADTNAVLPGRTLHYGLIPDEWLTDTPIAQADDTRTNRIILTALEQMPQLTERIARFGAARVAVVLGTSTSGIEETQRGFEACGTAGPLPAEFPIRRMNLSEPALFAAKTIGAAGPAYSICNVCAAGSMAIISAARLLQAGLADAVLTGGIDGYSRFTTLGFSGLGALSETECLPFASERRGINLGEGGSLLLLTREPSALALAGWSDTSDAHHISAPDPTGDGAARAMLGALESAGLAPGDIDLVLAHGTATPHNDAMEALAVHRVFGDATPVAGLKHLTGHTLAGAGALQAAIAAALLTENPQGRLPVALAKGEPDETLAPARILRKAASLGRPLRAVLANAFAFGGSNASFILMREAAHD